MKQLVNKTNGKKTKSFSALSVLFEMILLCKPNLIDDNMASAIRLGINSGLFASLIHAGWRNRKKITEYVTDIFTKNK